MNSCYVLHIATVLTWTAEKKNLTLNELESSYSENASTHFKHLGRKEEKS